MRTFLHFRTHDETRFLWHTLYAPFSLTATVVLTVLVVLMLALLAT
jgi:hypothetical protein